MAMAAAGRAEVRRDDALNGLLPSPAPSSPFSPLDLDALQQLKLRSSASPIQASFSGFHDQPASHYSQQPAIRIHSPTQSDAEASFLQSHQQSSPLDVPLQWQQIQQQDQAQHLDQGSYWHHDFAAGPTSSASDLWDHSALWDLSSDANFGLGPAQIPNQQQSYHQSQQLQQVQQIRHQQQQQQQQQKRASSASSYASYGPHTPPQTSNTPTTSVQDFEPEALQYPLADGFSTGLTQEVLRDFDKFCADYSGIDTAVESASYESLLQAQAQPDPQSQQYQIYQQQLQQQQNQQQVQQQRQSQYRQLQPRPQQKLAPTHSQTHRFSRDAQQIFQNQRRLAQKRIMSQDSNGVMAPPTLPRTESTDTDGGFKSSGEPAVPKLARTMSDVYAETLFHSNTNESLPPSSLLKQHSPHDGQSAAEMIKERLQEAQIDQLKRSQSPTGSASRQKSPFKHQSPESPQRDQFQTRSDGHAHPRSVAQVREWEKFHRDQAAAAQHSSQIKGELNEPVKTVSPKEVDLDYEEPVDASIGVMFPEPPAKRQKKESSPVSRFKPTVTRENTRTSEASDLSQASFGSMATSRGESSQSTNGAGGSGKGAAQYSFFNSARRKTNTTGTSAGNDSQPPTPVDQVPQLPSGESSRGGEYDQSPYRKRSQTSSVATPSTPRAPTLSKQESTENDEEREYAYTCTYHGCTKRFESQSALQKHKREIHHSTAHHSRNSLSSLPPASTTPTGHRKSASVDESDSATPPGAGGPLDANSQAGPHICTRTNPATGKPCNSQFSRPYDLTRHEDTIHNNRKEKVRCGLCRDEKTFSRSDALTRHMRVVHGQKDGPSTKGRGR